VLRGGERRRIAGREVVRGDVLVLSEGDRVAADARLADASHLEVDESLLTGESVPVLKGADDAAVHAGTLVVRGHALAVVDATGPRTAMGRIGTLLSSVETERTRLQVEVGSFVKATAIGGALVCAALTIGYGATRGRWMEALLAGIALAMSLLPEELPVILTLFMALGAWRISRMRVLTRRLPALEALGAATVLCCDKTGTMTENAMRVARLWAARKGKGAEWAHTDGALPEAVHEVLELAMLASRSGGNDPMDLAIHRLGALALRGTEHVHQSWTLGETGCACWRWRVPASPPASSRPASTTSSSSWSDSWRSPIRCARACRARWRSATPRASAC
jgi:Ca2+-transporting ATPase